MHKKNRCGSGTSRNESINGPVSGHIFNVACPRPPLAMEAFSDLEADVRQSILRVAASPFVPHKDQVRGFVFEVESGKLREVTK